MKQTLSGLSALAVGLIFTIQAHAIGISFDSTSGELLEDAVLWGSIAGDPPRFVVPLGDFDLSTATDAVVNIPVGDGSSTHWWLLGHRGSDIVYSSNRDLLGVDALFIEPFDAGDAFTIPTVIAQLGVVNSGGSFSLDIAALLAVGHSSHVTADGNSSLLWLFSSPGSDLGRVAVSINTDEPPGFDDGQLPVPSTVLLVAVGLLAISRNLARPKSA